MTTKDQLPPLAEIDPVFHHPDHHAKWSRSEIKWIQQYATDYALAALAQQAQEPVAWMLPRDGDECAVFREPQDYPFAKAGWTPLYTTPQPQPAPPVPVDERADFEAWYSDHATKHNAHGLTFTVEGITELREADHYGEHRTYLNNLWEGWQARAALQSPAPQATKGQP